MATLHKTRTVSYRRVVAQAPGSLTPGSRFNFQSYLEKAKAKVAQPWIRKISSDGTRSQFLSHLVSKQSCMCGVLVLCEDNRLIPLVDHETDGSTWEGAIEAKDEKGKRRKFPEQALYFAVRENHVAVIPTREFGTKDFAGFATWFIQTKAEIATGWLFGLQNIPSKEAVQKLKDKRITGINIGGSALKTEKVPAPESGQGKHQKWVKKLKTDPLLMSWIKSVLNNDAILDNLENSDDPGSLEVELEIKYKSRSEKDSQEVMRALAATVGDNIDLNPEIKLEGKTKITGEELTIGGSVSVQAPGGNLSGDDAMTRLAEWLTESIKSGKVWG